MLTMLSQLFISITLYEECIGFCKIVFTCKFPFFFGKKQVTHLHKQEVMLNIGLLDTIFV